MNRDGAYGLSAEVIEKIASVFRAHQAVVQVILYGSRAKGTAKKNSDIDLTICKSQISWSELMRIESEIDDLLLPYKIDLSIFEQIDNDSLRDHIQLNGLPFYNSPNSLSEEQT